MVYECHICGDVVERLANVKFKNRPVCDGVKYAKHNVLRRSLKSLSKVEPDRV